MKTSIIYDIPFYNGTKEELIKETQNRLENNIRTVLFTPNGEILYHATQNLNFKNTLQKADICIPDGVSVLKVAKNLGIQLNEKIAGVELGFEIMKSTSLPTFLLGAKPGFAEKAEENLKKQSDQFKIVGTYHGYFSKEGEENKEVIEKINQSGAKILIVCFGSPLQEEWIIHNKDSLPQILLFMGLGGSIDIYAKKEKRAPNLFLKLKLEWLYRMLKHPERIKRNIVILKLIYNSNKNK